MVDLEIGLDEGLPVDVVFVDADRIEHEAAEIPVGYRGDFGEVNRGIAPVKSRPFQRWSGVECSLTQGWFSKRGRRGSPFMS